MNFRKIILSLLVIVLAVSLSVAVIWYAAQDKQITIEMTEGSTFSAPMNMAHNFIEDESVLESIYNAQNGTDYTTANGPFSGINAYFAETTTEMTSDTPTEPVTEPTTEETTPAEPTTEAILFEPDFSANNYNDNGFKTVGTDYFNDAIFIGNSRLQGFILYSKVPDLRSYTYVGLSVKTYFSKDAFTIDGKSLTAAQALEANPDFQKVYLKFGINELGWVSNDQFREDYRNILEHIYQCNPNAIIFVQSVLPVSQYAIDRDPSLDNGKIAEYNNILIELASQYGACYLDVASIFTDEEGYLPYELSFDGVHLHQNSVQMWLRYLLGHGVE